MNENEMTYYKMFKLDKEIDVELSNGNSVHLNPGFYKFNYCLSGEEPEHKFQYSSDRMKWKDCDDFCTSLYEFDMLNEKVNELMIGKNVMTFARLEYVETIYYREKAVPVFLDDYGQCFFAVFEGKEIGLGSFNVDYEDEIRDMIDCHESMKTKGIEQHHD